MSTATIKTAIITAERCDRCLAAARVQARHLDLKLDLFLCGHHGRELGQPLTQQGWVLLAVTPAKEA